MGIRCGCCHYHYHRQRSLYHTGLCLNAYDSTALATVQGRLYQYLDEFSPAAHKEKSLEKEIETSLHENDEYGCIDLATYR